MKTIEIDDDVFAYLQSQAIPYYESTLNHVIRRLLKLPKKVPQKETFKTQPRKSNGKARKADLAKLVQSGRLREEQELFFNAKGKKLSNEYKAEISGNHLFYQNKIYTMSRLVAEIFDQEGCGIPSKSYRGPEYWYTSNGISVRTLWEDYLSRGI